MTQQFTASEVRKLIERLTDHNHLPAVARACLALRAFADMLEAQERAVPVAVVKDSDALYTGWLSWTGEPAPPETRLYTHPARATQAQPPAASVTVDAVMRVIDGQRRFPYCSIDEKQAFRNELEAALAAQENPNG